MKTKISKNQIDLWILDRTRRVKKIPSLLSAREIREAKQMKSRLVQKRFQLTRNHLRWILARYLNGAPKEINFSFGPLGKPKLKSPRTSLEFNLSHSKDLIIFGISQKPIGVDLEKIKKRPKLEKIAARFFSEKNYRYLLKLDAKKKISFFFQIWTATEAYLKAHGKGVGSIEYFKDKISISKNSPGVVRLKGWNIFLRNVVKSYSLGLATPLKNPEIRIFKI